jgi:hypothetical protein
MLLRHKASQKKLVSYQAILALVIMLRQMYREDRRVHAMDQRGVAHWIIRASSSIECGELQ